MQYENLNETCSESFHKALLHCSLKALKKEEFFILFACNYYQKKSD